MISALYTILPLLLATTQAVTHGDEAYRGISRGNFFVFCNGNSSAGIAPSVDVVDPESMSVVKTIPMPAGTNFADAVYMETCDGSEGTYAIVNDRIDYIHVLDAKDQELLYSIPSSAGPVHLYGVPQTEEVYSHADRDGVWDIINLADVSQASHSDILAHIEDEGHGKLLYDMEFFPFAFVSNVAESVLIEFNLETKEITRFLNFTDDSNHPLYCPGTHGLAYSKENKHIFATCSNVGLIEVDIETFQVVHKHSQVQGGQVYATPDEKYIVGIDKSNNKVTVLRPGNNAQQSAMAFPSIDGTAPGSTAGNPDKVAFFMKSDGTYRLFFSLTTPNFGDDSGMGYIDIYSLEMGLEANPTLNYIQGGTVDRGGWATYRSINDGGKYIATPVNNPYPGVMIVDGESATLVGVVRTNSGPTRVLWVPESFTGAECNKSGNDNNSNINSLSGGAIAAIVICVIIAVLLVAAGAYYFCCRPKQADPAAGVKLDDSSIISAAQSQVEAPASQRVV